MNAISCPPTALRTVCAWCKAVMANPEAKGPVSHGICPACQVQAMAEINEHIAQVDHELLPERY